MISGINFTVKLIVRQGAVAVFMMTEQITNRRLPLDDAADQRGIGFELGRRQLSGINGDIFDADGTVVEADDMPTKDVFSGQLIEGAVAVDKIVSRNIDFTTAGNITPDLVIDAGRTKKIQGFLQRGDGDKVNDYHLWIAQSCGRFTIVMAGIVGGQLQALRIEDQTLDSLRIKDRCCRRARSDSAQEEGNEQEKLPQIFFRMNHGESRFRQKEIRIKRIASS